MYKQVTVHFKQRNDSNLLCCQNHNIKTSVKIRIYLWPTTGPHNAVLCHSEESLCLLPLYFLFPLPKHLHHQPLVPPPLCSETEKVLVMVFLKDQKCAFVNVLNFL